MDLVADMLLVHLKEYAHVVEPQMIRPPMQRRLTAAACGNRSTEASDSSWSRFRWNADRLINRFWDYPHLLRRIRHEFDVFHVVDHSYAQLVHHLPPERTVVTCHDLDTFKSVLEPHRERRSRLYSIMTKRILEGLRKAAFVVCDTSVIRDEILAYGLVAQSQLAVVHLGVHPSCSPEPDPGADRAAERLLGSAQANSMDVLHVGSTIPRKRIDVLLEAFAAFRRSVPQARLVRVGGQFTAAQVEQVRQLGLTNSITVLPPLERDVLAAVYRRASLVVLPSEREGFGLPIVEALACGCPVIASDLPVLQEVGGDVVSYCRVGDVAGWSEALLGLCAERIQDPDRWAARCTAGIRHSSRFTWAEYSRKMASLYLTALSENVT